MPQPTPPETSSEQRTAALEDSKVIRRLRAKVRKNVKDRKLHPFDVLIVGRHGNGEVVEGRMEVHQLLTAIQGIGPKRADKLMIQAGLVGDGENRVHIHVDELNGAMRDSLMSVLSYSPFVDAEKPKRKQAMP